MVMSPLGADEDPDRRNERRDEVGVVYLRSVRGVGVVRCARCKLCSGCPRAWPRNEEGALMITQRHTTSAATTVLGAINVCQMPGLSISSRDASVQSSASTRSRPPVETSSGHSKPLPSSESQATRIVNDHTSHSLSRALNISLLNGVCVCSSPCESPGSPRSVEITSEPSWARSIERKPVPAPSSTTSRGSGSGDGDGDGD
jgi:hypothetical protein